MNAAPYRQGYTGQSVHGGNMRTSTYQQSQSVSVTLTSKPGGESAFKKRLNSFLGDDEGGSNSDFSASSDNSGDAGMSKEDMLKQAKDRKKIAKANLNLKK